MTTIVCLDSKNGIGFAGRRQSRDAVVLEKIKTMSKDTQLWVSRYTLHLFEETGLAAEMPQLRVSEDPQHEAGTDEMCFVEGTEISREPDEFILFFWNRAYPATSFLSLMPNDWTCMESQTLQGVSHPRIDMLRIRKKEGTV